MQDYVIELIKTPSATTVKAAMYKWEGDWVVFYSNDLPPKQILAIRAASVNKITLGDNQS